MTFSETNFDEKLCVVEDDTNNAGFYPASRYPRRYFASSNVIKALTLISTLIIHKFFLAASRVPFFDLLAAAAQLPTQMCTVLLLPMDIPSCLLAF
jgi:hypothetical protein